MSDVSAQENSGRFKFNLPLEIVKADETGWKVKGLASTEDKDLQGEIVKQAGLDISPIKEGRGLFNYEHKNDPENIIGIIEDANINDKGLLVEGYLFKKHKRAQAIAEIMQSLSKDHKNRVQLSIEGKVKERGEDKKEIKQAIIDRVALTFEPVNQKTYINFAKSLFGKEQDAEKESVIVKDQFDPKEITTTLEMDTALEKGVEKIMQDSELEKTLEAGYGTADAPATRKQGSSLTPEALAAQVAHLNNEQKDEEEEEQEKHKKLKPKIPSKNKLKAKLKRSIERAVEQFPNVSSSILIKKVLKSFKDKFAQE